MMNWNPGQEFLFGEPHKKAVLKKTASTCDFRISWQRHNDVRAYFEEGRDGMYWYDNTPKAILQLFDGNVERTQLYIGLLAATSPLENIRSNVRLALKALRMHDDLGADEKMFAKVFRFDAHFCNVMRVIWNRPLSGPKVTAFYQNLMGPAHFPDAANQVTVDRWMMRAVKGICPTRDKKDPGAADDAPSKKEYDCVSDLIRKLAAEVGVEPRQYQAAVWVGIKKLCGSPEDIADPFEVALARQLNDKQTYFDWDAPSPPVTQQELDPAESISLDEIDDPLAGLEHLAEGFDEGEMGQNPPEVEAEVVNKILSARALGMDDA